MATKRGVGTLGWSWVTGAVLCGVTARGGPPVCSGHGAELLPTPRVLLEVAGELQSSGEGDAAVSVQGCFACRSPTCVSS